MNEITNQIATVPDNQHSSMMNFVADAVQNPNIDVAKLRELLAMQREIAADESKRHFIRAMAAAQAEIEPVARSAQNTQTNSTYAKLEHVDAAIRPIYTRHGFSLSFDEEPVGSDGSMTIVCEVSHVDGYTKMLRLNAPPDTMGPKGTPTKTALHGRGSTVTFLRRYLTCNAFNVVLRNQDDDGNRGGQRFLTQQQIDVLEEGIEHTGVDRSGFLQEFMGVADVGEIQDRDYTKALNGLVNSAANKRIGWRPPFAKQAPRGGQ